MAATDRSALFFGMVDHSAEQSGTLLYVDPVAVDGTNWDTLITDVATSVHDLLKAGIITITKLNMTRTTLSIIVDESAGSIPAAADAQREWYIKFLYQDTDNGNKKYTYTIPAPVDAVVPSGTDEVSLANVLIAAWVTLFEAYCLSPEGGAVDVLSARIGGRNS